MRNFITILLFSLGLLGYSSVSTADDLYQARIVVASTSTQEQQVALPKALEQVLVKVTGRQDILNMPAIQAALSNPELYLASYDYSYTPKTTINVTFSSIEVQKLLKDSNLQTWKNRPIMLVWLTIVKNDGQPSLVAYNSTEFVDDIHANAERRGIQIVLPVGDLQDLSASKDDQDHSQLLQRYKADVILFGAMTANANGEWQASWQLSNASKILHVTDKDLAKILGLAIDKAVNSFAQQAQNNSANNNEIVLKVTGIKGVSDYVQLLDYLNTLSSIKKITPEKINTNFVKLHITLTHDVQSLNINLQQHDKLLPVPTQESGVDLIYQWQGK